MTRTLLRYLDGWALTGFLASPRSLAIYRIVFALALLLFMVPGWSWAADAPASFFDPPPGPMALLDVPPVAAVLHGSELIAIAAAVALLLGYRTPIASWVVVGAYLIGMGVGNSFGKIDHGTIVLAAPAVLAHSGWGQTLSLDARRVPTAPLGDPREPREVWHLSLLAVIISLGLLSAGSAKLASGWLSLDTGAAQSHVLANYYVAGRDAYAAGVLVRLDARWFWEVVDWTTVALETMPVLLLPWPRLWRRWLIGLLGMHLGIALVMNIVYLPMPLLYGAYLPWGRFLPARSRWGDRLLVVGPIVVACLAAGTLLGQRSVLSYLPKPWGQHIRLGVLAVAPLLPLAVVLRRRRSRARGDDDLDDQARAVQGRSS